MKLFNILLILFLVCAGAHAGSVSGGGGSDDSLTENPSGGERDVTDFQEEIDFSGEAPDDNIFDQDEVIQFINKGLINWTDWVSGLPQGKTYKVLSKNGWIDPLDGTLKEKGWSQIITDFTASDDFFEYETDRVAYLQENQDFNDGVATDMPIHRKQLQRLFAYAASSNGISLSESARIPLALGSLYWTNKNQHFAFPTAFCPSYKSSEEGLFVSPSTDEVGFVTNLVPPPYEVDWSSDLFGWFFQEHVDN